MVRNIACMTFQRSKSGLVGIMIQILAWMAFAIAIFLYQPLTAPVVFPFQFWLKQGIILFMLISAYYINAYWLMPRFLLKNHNYYLLFILAIIILFLAIDHYSETWLNLHSLMDTAFKHHGPPKRHEDHNHFFDVLSFIMIALILGISTSITLVRKWQADQQLNLVLQQEKTSSELSFLKAQINPHFFFNTLNNIYALTYADADTSRKAIHQLSRMMRYLLYDTQQTYTQLSQEINFIKDFISLMQLRLTDIVKIKFDYPENLNDVQIAPMLFLPFVENAFKHGTSVNEPSDIYISIKQQNNQLELVVNNTIIANQSPAVDEYGGIGLENTRRRLDILYPGRHILIIDPLAAPNRYSIYLKLDLS
jgi:two-component system, LytTR family, sensor kinase